MTRICPKCGALLLTSAEDCSFCESEMEIGVLLQKGGRRPEVQTQGDDHQWRLEVTRRLGDYRARKRQLFGESTVSAVSQFPSHTTEAPKIHRHSPARPASRSTEADRLDICIQPEFDFASFPDDRAHPQSALVPVAALADRRWAGILDAFFIVLTVAAFATLFHALGGEISLGKLDLAVGATILYLFYSQYFLLFMALAGATPGMQICGLTTVRLDGSLPGTRQLLWRSFGYLLSGLTGCFGFLWSLWDEDHFTWQDRISHTYITSAVPFGVDNPGLSTN